MKPYQLCGAAWVETLLDFGAQPIYNRFPKTATDPEATFPMLLEQCQACGLVQTTQPVPAVERKPRVDWITYNKPEGHVDTLADKLAKLPGLTSAAAVGGISFKDDSVPAGFCPNAAFHFTLTAVFRIVWGTPWWVLDRLRRGSAW